jgi:hypothetical protein
MLSQFQRKQEHNKMIHTFFTKHSALPLFIFLMLLASLACNTITAGTPQQQEYPEKITIERDITYGPGPFDVPDPQVGLSDLSSYKGTLILGFDGTRAGKAKKWSKTYVMLTIKEPAMRQLTIDKSGDLANLDPVFMAELDGADYKKIGQAACETSAIQEGNSLADGFEPTSFLTGVFGAEEAGSDKVNGVAVNHYTFDQRALGEDGVTESTGELWVASEGGYLVKYVLTRKAKADYFGEGVEGTLTLDYELTDVNKQDTAITLPDDCPPGFIDAPRLPDARDISNRPGVLAYETASTIADAAAFYQKNLPDLGWEAQDPPTIADTIAILTYKQADKVMLIIIKPGDTGTQVRIVVSKSSPLQ